MKTSLGSVTVWTLLSCIGFVFDGLLIRMLKSTHSALSISFLRVSFACLTLLGFLLLQYIFHPTRKRITNIQSFFPWISLVRVVIAATGHIFWSESFHRLPFAEVATFKFMSPIVNTTIGLFMLRTAVNSRQIGGMVCMLLGTVILKYNTDFSTDSLAIIYPILAVITLAICHFLGKQALKQPGNFPMQECLRYLIGSSVFLGMILLIFEPHWPKINIWVFGLGIANAIAYYGLHYGLGLGSFYYVMSLGCFRWVISMLIGVFHFHDAVTFSLFGGGFFILLGIGCMVASEVKKRSA